MRYLYRIHDFDPLVKEWGALHTLESDAKKYNELGFGIFKTVNSFSKPIRSVDYLESLDYIIAEIDTLPGPAEEVPLKKKEVITQIVTAPITPSLVIESQKGFHVYFKIKNDWIFLFGKEDALRRYSSLQTSRIIPYYKSDPQCSDACRVLRVPQYYHCKKHQNPYLIKKIFESEHSYTYNDFISRLPTSKLAAPSFGGEDDIRRAFQATSDSIFCRAGLISPKDALTKLSGTAYVRQEKISFRENVNGTTQILCNGNGTGSYIRIKEGQEQVVSSLFIERKGGPTWISWLAYYFKNGTDVDWKALVVALKFVMGEK